jgi:hypothetical protein
MHFFETPWDCQNSWLYKRRIHRKDFGSSHILRFIGKTIVFRFFINENLMVKHKRSTLLEKTHWQEVLVVFLQPIKQMAPALLAKSSLRPLGRIEDRYLFFPGKGDIAAAINHKDWPTRPLLAHVAVTCTNFMTHIYCSHLNCVAKATPLISS